MPSQLDEAMSRIRGPRIEDLFGPEAASGFSSDIEEPGPDRGFPTRAMVDTGPTSVANLPTPPGYLRRPDGSLRSMDPTRSVEAAAGREAMRPINEAASSAAPYAASGLRLAGQLDPTHVFGPVAAEVGATALDEFNGRPATLKGFATRAAEGIAGKALFRSGVAPVMPHLFQTAPRRFVGEMAAGNLFNRGIEATDYALGEGERPTLAGAVERAPGEALLMSPFAGVAALGAPHERAAMEFQAALKTAYGKRQNLPNAVVESHKGGGSTYDLDGNDMLGTDAWSVSLFPDRSAKVEGRALAPDDVTAFMKAHDDVFSGQNPEIHVGTWDEAVKDPVTKKETGEHRHWLDPVVLVQDKDAAIALAKKYGQKAIFNLKTFEEVGTGGSGAPMPNLPGVRSRLNEVPATNSGLFTELRQGANDARINLDRLMTGAADRRGQEGAIALGPEGIRGDSGMRLQGQKMGPVNERIRQNLSRLAADTIMHSKKPITRETWSAEMLATYGPDVTKHLKQAWDNGNILLTRIAQKKIKALPTTQRTIALLRAGSTGEDWYGPMRRELHKAFGDDTDMFLRFLAATSPRANITENLQKAMESYVQWKGGATDAHPEVIANAQVDRQNRALTEKGIDPLPLPHPNVSADTPGFKGQLFPEWMADVAAGREFGGPKVKNFLAAMRGDENAVVLDTWMLRYLGYQPSKTGEYEFGLSGKAGDKEYQIAADWVAGEAEKQGMKPAAFQERIWRGLKRTSDGKGTRDIKNSTDEPYFVVMKDKLAKGEPLFSEATLRRFRAHEDAIAQDIESVFQEEGKVAADAPGMERPADTFDWSTGTETPPTEKAGKRTRGSVRSKPTTSSRSRKRPGQTGSVRLDAILPIDAMLKAARGVKNLAEYTGLAVARFGGQVKPHLKRAWALGTRTALTMAAVGERESGRMSPPPPRAADRAPVERPSRLGSIGQAADHEPALLDHFGNPLNEPTHETLARLERFRAATARDEGRHHEARQHAEEAERVEAAPRTPAYLHEAIERLGHDEVRRVLEPYAAGDVMGRKLALARAASPKGLKLMGALSRAGVIWNFLGRGAATGVAAKVAAINAFRATSRAIATIPGAAYSRVMHRGGQHVYLNELTPGQQGFTHAFGPALGHAWELLSKGVTSDDLMSAQGRGLPHEEIQRGPAALRAAIYAPQRALGAVDRVFIETLAEHDTAQLMHTRARGQAIREARSGTDVQDRIAELKAEWQQRPPDWALEHKERLAHRMSDQAGFGTDSLVGQGANAILALNKIPVIGPLMAPFTKSILNASRSAVQASPYGFYDVYKMRQAGKSREAAGDFGERHGYGRAEMQRARESGALAREEAMRFGESVVGSSVIGLAVYANLFNGAVTGAAPRGMGASERDQLQSERPFSSIHTPAGWLPLQSALGHLAPAVQALADAHAQYIFDRRENTTNPERVKDVYEASVDSAATGLMTMVRGVPMLDRGNPGSQQFYRTLFNAVPFVPGIGKNLVNVTDPYQRAPKGVVQEVMSFTPGLSTRLQARIRATGEAFERPSQVNPFSTTPPSHNDARNMAAAAGYRIPVPNISALTDNDGNRRALPLTWSRPMNSAIGWGNAQALNRAKDNLTPDMDRDDIAAEFKSAVEENRKIILDNARTALDEGRRPTITELVSGIE